MRPQAIVGHSTASRFIQYYQPEIKISRSLLADDTESTIDIAGIAVLEFGSGARRLVRIGNSANRLRSVWAFLQRMMMKLRVLQLKPRRCWLHFSVLPSGCWCFNAFNLKTHVYQFASYMDVCRREDQIKAHVRISVKYLYNIMIHNKIVSILKLQ